MASRPGTSGQNQLEETGDKIEETLMKFFPCRLGPFKIPAQDDGEIEIEPVVEQKEVCSDDFIARYLHSWPVEKVMGLDEFFEYQTSISIGCPDWDYRAKIWRPTESDSDQHTGKTVHHFDQHMGKTVVYFVMQCTATHTAKTKFFDQDIEPSTGALPTKILMPMEMGHVVINGDNKIEYFESWKVVNQVSNTTGDLCGVPGLLHALDRPLPPPATELLAPIPPYTAPDNRDPNWKLRIQVFKQICKSYPLDKKSLKTLIVRQKDELQQHIDYLRSIRNYCV